MFLTRAVRRRLSRLVLTAMLVVWALPFGVHGAMAAPSGWMDICTTDGVERHALPGNSGESWPHGVLEHCPLCLLQVGGLPATASLQLPTLPASSPQLGNTVAGWPAGPVVPPFDSRAPPV